MTLWLFHQRSTFTPWLCTFSARSLLCCPKMERLPSQGGRYESCGPHPLAAHGRVMQGFKRPLPMAALRLHHVYLKGLGPHISVDSSSARSLESQGIEQRHIHDFIQPSTQSTATGDHGGAQRGRKGSGLPRVFVLQSRILIICPGRGHSKEDPCPFWRVPP